jgi:hypothetical protein
MTGWVRRKLIILNSFNYYPYLLKETVEVFDNMALSRIFKLNSVEVKGERKICIMRLFKIFLGDQIKESELVEHKRNIDETTNTYKL